jgi:hypothetical protein
MDPNVSLFPAAPSRNSTMPGQPSQPSSPLLDQIPSLKRTAFNSPLASTPFPAVSRTPVQPSVSVNVPSPYPAQMPSPTTHQVQQISQTPQILGQPGQVLMFPATFKRTILNHS